MASQAARPLHAIRLPDMLAASAAAYAARPAMALLGRRWSYAGLGAWVDRVARGLQDLGVGPGMRFGLCLPNTPYFIVLYYAALKAGATVVNYNPLYVERELTHQIRDSGTTVMAVLDLEVVYRRVANVAAAAGLQRIIVCPMVDILTPAKAALFRLFKRRDIARVPDDGRHIAFAALQGNPAPPTPVAIDPLHDIAVLQYTGGTTGVPKGAMLTHANLTINAAQVQAHWSGARLGHERALAVLPFFHVFAMTTVLNYNIGIGSEIVMLPRFELRQTLAAIARHKITVFHAVPTIYTAINAAAATRKVALQSIVFGVSGGAPLPREAHRRFVELTGCKLVEGYGLTEAGPVVACNPPDGRMKDGSVGIPMQGTALKDVILCGGYNVYPRLLGAVDSRIGLLERQREALTQTLGELGEIRDQAAARLFGRTASGGSA